jgi:hypothetical protein
VINRHTGRRLTYALSIATVICIVFGAPATTDLFGYEQGTGEAGRAAVPETGAPLDAASFAISRELPAGDAGLVSVAFDASVLAESRGPSGNFADVRVIDPSGRQVPYLVERRAEPIVVDLEAAPVAPKAADAGASAGRRSVYRVILPFTKLPGARLVLETPARVFRRNVSVSVERPPDRRRRDPWLEQVAAAPWTHADPALPAPPLVLPLRELDTTELLITVEEGDNAPLPLAASRLLLPSYRARFYRPQGTPLRIVYGRDDLAAPRYDLALLSSQVMGSAAREVSLPPAAQVRTRPGPEVISPRVFWVVLGGSVLVLLGIVFRLVWRKGDAGAA